jgi:hypothetical protein
MKFVFSVFLLILCAVGLSACRENFFWNQKLTVTVETPLGERSGAAVVSEGVTYGRQWLSGSAVQYGIKGEATVVEVASRKYLFALLGEGSTKELAVRVWWDTLPHAENGEKFRIIEGLREKREVPPKEYPLLVSFTDFNDPKSVFEVKPDDLAAAFGPGYNLQSITLEITDEPVTEGKVESVLGWIRTLRTRLIPIKSKFAKEYRPIENVGPEYFVYPYRIKEK